MPWIANTEEEMPGPWKETELYSTSNNTVLRTVIKNKQSEIWKF